MKQSLLLGLTLAVFIPAIAQAEATHETVADDDIQYAPQRKPLSGNPALTCISMQFLDRNRSTGCGKMTAAVAKTMRRNSRGLLQLKPKNVLVSVPFKWRYRKKAAFWAMNKIKSKYYILPRLSKHSHAGSKIAWVAGSSSAPHEVGHLLGLGHAGIYKEVKKKKGKGTQIKLSIYADGQSLMSRFASAFITAPQYYHLGWLPKNEAAMFEEGKIYSLKRINRFDESGLATVIVPPSYFRGEASSDELDSMSDDSTLSSNISGDLSIQGGKKKKSVPPRKAFVAFPIGCKNGCVALYLSNGGGSQRVKLFGREYYDEKFTGLHIKNLGFENGKIRVQIDLDPKPASFTQEDEGEVTETSEDFI